MKKWQYFTAPLALIFLTVVSLQSIRNFAPTSWAVSVPVTFTDGQVLTAAQLNSVVTTIYSAFNGHDHDGSDGEPSTISPAAIDTDFEMTTGAITNIDKLTSTSGTQMTLNETGDDDVIVGSSSRTGEVLLGIEAAAANAVLRFSAASGSNVWDFEADNSSGNLETQYNSASKVVFTTEGGIATDGQGASNDIAWETYSGTSCSSSTTVSCTFDVDTSAPGSGLPLSFSCMVENSASDGQMTGGAFNSPSSSQDCLLAFYDSSQDDLSVTIGDGVGCDTYKSRSYNCLVFYTPS